MSDAGSGYGRGSGGGSGGGGAPANPNRVFVGRLPDGTTASELKDLFEPCGKIRSIDVKAGYAFVMFDNPDEVARAVDELAGYMLRGSRIQVERSLSRMRGPTMHPPRGEMVPPGRTPGEGRCFYCGQAGHWKLECPRNPENRGRERGGRRGFDDRAGGPPPRRGFEPDDRGSQGMRGAYHDDRGMPPSRGAYDERGGYHGGGGGERSPPGGSRSGGGGAGHYDARSPPRGGGHYDGRGSPQRGGYNDGDYASEYRGYENRPPPSVDGRGSRDAYAARGEYDNRYRERGSNGGNASGHRDRYSSSSSGRRDTSPPPRHHHPHNASSSSPGRGSPRRGSPPDAAGSRHRDRDSAYQEYLDRCAAFDAYYGPGASERYARGEFDPATATPVAAAASGAGAGGDARASSSTLAGESSRYHPYRNERRGSRDAVSPPRASRRGSAGSASGVYPPGADA